MSWIKTTWGDDKENQFKGFLLILVFGSYFFAISLLFSLRWFGLGEGLSMKPIIYIFFLTSIGFFFSIKNRFKLATISAVLIFIELTLGYAHPASIRLGITSPFGNLLPITDSNRYQFHPLLGAIPSPEFQGENFSHTLHGTRSVNPEFDGAKPHIAVFGGSTTYDLGVTNDQNTWVSQLNKLLPSYSFSNNGVPGYSSAEHVVQTAFYAARGGSLPICSVYYIGWNDIRSFGFDELDSGFANFHLLSQYGVLRVRADVNSPSPILNLLARWILRQELPQPIRTGGAGRAVHADDPLFEIVRNNLEAIVALNNARGINTVFVAQVLNRAKLTDTDSTSYGWIPFVVDQDVWPLQDRYNLLLQQEAQRLSVGFVYPNIEAFNDADFVDTGHFNDDGAKKFASIVSGSIEKLCSIE